MANSDRFGMLYYDFGPEENFWRYGSDRAPIYDLNKYTVDTYVYCAEFDSISVLGDCKMFAAMMPNLKRLEIVDDFTHSDFTIGLTANEKVCSQPFVFVAHIITTKVTYLCIFKI